jgi:hypothetical protein
MVFDSIQISLPPNIKIKEFYNVESFETTDSKMVVKKLKSTNSLGFVVSLDEIIKEKHVEKRIVVDFVSGEKISYSRLFIANIYRPELSVVEKPNIVVLEDNSNPRDLVNLSLRISGFGRIEVMTEISIGGRFEPNLEPLYRETTRRVMSSLKSKEVHANRKENIHINPTYLQETAKDFIDRIRKGELSLDLEREDIEDFKTWISNEANYAKISELVSEQLESILIDSLLYYFDRYPTDGVELFGGKPAIILQSAIQNLNIRFRYRDSLHNEYEPVQIGMPVQDSRSNKKVGVKVPINIKWIQEQLNPLGEGVRC